MTSTVTVLAQSHIARRGETPTCQTGWKQVTDDCPACGPDGPCTEEGGPLKPSLKRKWARVTRNWFAPEGTQLEDQFYDA
jgi:hypothetical protein